MTAFFSLAGTPSEGVVPTKLCFLAHTQHHHHIAMPQTSGGAQALQDIHTEVESIAYTYALGSSSSEEDNYEENLEDFLAIQDIITSDWYLPTIPR